MNEYLIITRITGMDSTVTVSNFIKDDISYVDKSILGERICNKEGVYFTPYYELDQNTLLISNSDRFSRNEEFKFYLPMVPDTLIINNLFDLLLLKDGELFSSKLMLNYYKLSAPNSSLNNNSYIYVEDENAAIGTTVKVVINTALLKEDAYDENIQISINNNGDEYFLGKTGLLDGDKDSWIPISTTGDRIVLSINVENKEDYTFSLSGSNRIQEYFAMIYQNELELKKVDQDVLEIFIHNKELVIVNNDLSSYIATPVRLGFITSDNYVYVQNDFDKIRLMYEE
ncbi:MAG: hypothetical protein DRQ43_09440 [Gammaproteobacteria bacterium]|nr:MAG: hypothetical protein DRQ43_09440 [Gammaproteobacteria bacterium]